MDKTDIASLTFFLAWFLGLGSLTIFHELGHALTALTLSRQHVYVYLGTNPTRIEQQPIKTFTIAKITFYLDPPGLINGIGYAKWSQKLSRPQQILALLGGPATTFLFFILLSYFTYISRLHASASVLQIWQYYLLQWLSLFAFIQFITTVVPFRYPSWWRSYADQTSDGYKIRYWLQHKQ